ncbi:MAG: division/cell wall cluster transcriptional repressor MraZ [Erysipelotrichaceae bacterium]|nr:division/cell wall cluster transcriptional repressor MraZ [Erysipelotrichaceae bacterium]MBQ1534612.1 division/cell wall cluster transcriptional repressor MraZ [Erysipelotrichaceae bacterium]MBQ5804526.1 division/cell wall cluster transcriptional repressor MraZ [Erysipelotrichaceae bacterium]
MFIGEYQHNLDAKGRIVVPGRFREELHESFILARGLDGCLSIYSLKQWDKMFEEIDKLPTTKKAARQYIRMLTSTATECTLDNQGRIQIPAFLSKPVNIVKECVVIGANDHIEIWDKATWDSYYLDASNSFEEVAENLNDLLHNE